MTKRLVFILVLCSSLAWGTAYTTNNASTQWHTTTHWTPNGIPGNRDTITIANGQSLTCEAGQICIIGTSPADDVSTPAIQCQGGLSYSTGILRVYGTLIYRGTVKACGGNWVGGDGVHGFTITHDSSLAASPSTTHYSWQNAGTGKWTLTGLAGAPGTWNIAAGSGYAGRLGGTSASWQSDGLLHATYMNFSDISSVTGGYAWVASRYASGDEFTCDHCTWTRSGFLAIGIQSGTANFSITNSTHTAGYNASYAIIDLQVISAKTGGTRVFQGNYVDGGYVKLAANAANAAIGLTFQDNFIFASSAAVYAPLVVTTVPSFASDLFKNNVMWTHSTGSQSTASMYLPAGAVSRLYALHSSALYPNCTSVNYHPMMIGGGTSVDLDQIISEVDCGGPSGAGDGIQISDGAVAATISLTNSIFLPGADGMATSVFSYGTHTATKPTVTGHNNTLSASFSTGACGFGTDAAAGVAGLFGDIKDNIFWNPASAAGCAAGSATSPAGMYTGAQDYNAIWNVTGTYWKGGAGVYTSTPGTHDQSGNPQFVDSERNFLKWCKSVDGTINTWDDCRAKFAAHAAGFTPSALIDYVRGGFKPQAAFIKTMSSTGTYVGAVPPDAPATRRRQVVVH